MIEFNLETSGGGAPAANFAVSVVGIGGSGANVLDRIALEGMPGAELICMTSDIRVLNNSMAARKVQLGAALTQGLGAGGDPELGLEAAQASEAEIRELFKGRAMIFLCTGLGGGSGSGAAPYVAKLARESGAFVVVFATMPFSFEGRRRQKQACSALDELRRNANALVTFENDRMGELVVPKKGIQEAFQQADRIIGQSVRAVTSLVTQPGLIRIGMDDLITALKNTDSRCLFGFGQAKGESRALEALAQALKSPLLDRGQMLAKAHNVLVHVCGGASMTLFEIETLMRELQKHVHEDAHLLFGAASDSRLGDHISVTILSSLGREGSVEILPPRTLADTQPKAAAQAPLQIAPLTPPAAPVEQVAPVAAAPAPVPVDAVPEPAPVAKAPVPAAEQLPVVRLVAPARNEQVAPVTRAIPAPPAPAAKVVEQKAPAPSKPVHKQPDLLPQPEMEEEEEEFTPPAPISRNGRAPAPVIQAEEEEEEDYQEEYFDEEEAPLAKAQAPESEFEEFEDDEEEEEMTPPPPIKKFAIRDILMKPRDSNGHGQKPQPAGSQHSPPKAQPAPQARPASIPGPRPSPISHAQTTQPKQPRPAPSAQQQTFDERLQGANRGRFEKTDPTLEEGEDLDVPTFLRKKR